MGSLKALFLAGAASLAAMSTARAADLFLPPPPPVEAPAYVPIEFSGGFYLRGDAGIGISDAHTRGSSFNPQNTPPDIRYEHSSFDDAAFVDLGIGYRFNNYFRADITGEYRAAAHFGSVESYNQGYFFTPQTSARQSDVYGGSIQTTTGLVNGYFDLGTWYCLTPFVGAGVGVANINVSSVTDQGEGGGVGYSSSHQQTNFAWALMAGVALSVTPSTKIELGYRYLDLGNASSGTITCQNPGGPCPNEVQHYKLASQDIRLGVRYTFNEAPPPPAYAPPLVRKY